MNYEVTLVFSNLYHNIFIEDCKIKCLIYVRGCNKIDLSDFLNRLTKADNLFENFKVNFMKNKDKVNRCNKCNLPETYETIEFDQENVCNICNGAKYKQTKIDWNERKKLLDQLIEKHKGKYSYDCIVPFSGGKDSTFQLYYLLKNSKFIIGNSSSGIMGAPYYGVTTINIGTRQSNRLKTKLIKNIPFKEKKIIKTINQVKSRKITKRKFFGEGNSAKKIEELLLSNKIWNISKQKNFIDLI